jgi:hypothetical protein
LVDLVTAGSDWGEEFCVPSSHIPVRRGWALVKSCFGKSGRGHGVGKGTPRR